MKSEPLVLRNSSELATLLRRQEIHLIPHRRRPIKLAMPELAEERRELWERKINGAYYSCGCGEGAAFLLLWIVLFPCYVAGFHDRHGPLFFVLLGLLSFVAFAVLGKALGILSARIRLRAHIINLTALLDETAISQGI